MEAPDQPLFNSNADSRRGRLDIANLLEALARALPSSSQREFARLNDVPESDLRYWQQRAGRISAHPEVVAFFERPVGLALLHQIVTAAQKVITQDLEAGARYVSQFLVLAGLSAFVASSHGAQAEATARMTSALVTYGREEPLRLAKLMTPRHITLVPDENFHEGCCLISIEPVSGYIVVEKPCATRDAVAWKQATEEGLKGLPVEVVQQVHDGAQALIKYTKSIDANYGPDIFHLQNRLFRLLSRPLQARLKHAQAAFQAAETTLVYQQRLAPSVARRLPPDSKVDLQAWLDKAQQAREEASQALAQAREHVQTAHTAIGELSEVYHPFDLATGKPRSAESVRADLAQRFAVLSQVAQQANLSPDIRTGIENEKALVDPMCDTIAFVHRTLETRLAPFALPTDTYAAVKAHWIPGLYLQQVAPRAKNAARRHELWDRAEELLAPLLDERGPLSGLTTAQLAALTTVVEECAHLFQPASSITEGRNGHRSLQHHHVHHLSEQRRLARRVLDNFFVRRPDRTTAAERFFGHPPTDLFTYLLEHLPYPARPGSPRPRVVPAPFRPQSAQNLPEPPNSPPQTGPP